jgi:hypothetical protein
MRIHVRRRPTTSLRALWLSGFSWCRGPRLRALYSAWARSASARCSRPRMRLRRVRAEISSRSSGTQECWRSLKVHGGNVWRHVILHVFARWIWRYVLALCAARHESQCLTQMFNIYMYNMIDLGWNRSSMSKLAFLSTCRFRNVLGSPHH